MLGGGESGDGGQAFGFAEGYSGTVEEGGRGWGGKVRKTGVEGGVEGGARRALRDVAPGAGACVGCHVWGGGGKDVTYGRGCGLLGM